MNIKIIDDITFPINRTLVLRRLGYNTQKSVLTDNVSAILDEEILRAEGVIECKGIVSVHNIEFIDGNRIRIRKTDKVFHSTALIKHLTRCNKGAIFACTIGGNLETVVSELFSKGEQARGVILDAIGSVAVEALAENLNQKITKDAYAEQSLTIRRFSPGYKDWKLSEQKILFSIINPKDIGIALTCSSIMNPEKSITGIVGWKKGVGAL